MTELFLIITGIVGALIGCTCTLVIDKEDIKLHHIIVYIILSPIVIPLGIATLLHNKGEGITIIKKRKKKDDKQG